MPRYNIHFTETFEYNEQEYGTTPQDALKTFKEKLHKGVYTHTDVWLDDLEVEEAPIQV